MHLEFGRGERYFSQVLHGPNPHNSEPPSPSTFIDPESVLGNQRFFQRHGLDITRLNSRTGVEVFASKTGEKVIIDFDHKTMYPVIP